MQHRARLAGWLSSPQRQRESAARAAKLALAHAGSPKICRFRDEISAARPMDEKEAGDAVDAALARLFADPNWLDDLIGGLSAGLTDDPFFVPPFQAIDNGLHGGLVLHDDAQATIALSVGGIEALAARKREGSGRRVIVFSGHRTRTRFLRAGTALLTFYALDADADRCRMTAQRCLADGDEIVLDGRTQAFVIEHAKSDLVMLQGSMKRDRGPLMVECDATTLARLSMTATDEAASRTQMLVSLLAMLDRETPANGARAAMTRVLDDGHAFVRWHAMRELIGLDPAPIFPALIHMAANDGDAEVRDVARKTLAMLRCPA